MSVQFAVISQDLQQGRHALVELGQVNHARQAFLELWPRLLGWSSLVWGFGFKHPPEEALYDFTATSETPLLALEVNHCRHLIAQVEGERFFVADPCHQILTAQLRMPTPGKKKPPPRAGAWDLLIKPGSLGV